MTMEPLTEKDIRASFVNCSKGEAGRVHLPRPLADVPWASLDFLGWRDPGAPDRGYVVTVDEAGPTGVALRGSPGVRRSFTKTTVCTLCMTGHPGTGVSLWVAARAGAAGRQANSVGAYICSDLACSLYLRGKKTTGLATRYEESLTLHEKVERTRANLGAFLTKVRAA